jgi:hypothetical protein
MCTVYFTGQRPWKRIHRRSSKMENVQRTVLLASPTSSSGLPNGSVRNSSETDCTRIGVFAYELTNRVPEIRVMSTILPCLSIVTLKAEYTILYARDHYIIKLTNLASRI